MNLLSRDEFRKAVFDRDGNKCVNCGQPAQDAHHIIERRLFDNGGYYLDNGASLCGPCHILAERTVLSCDDIRVKVGIQKPILPEHLYEDYEYDKWGNILHSNGTRIKGELFNDESVQKILKDGGVIDRFIPYIKYPRTYHLPFSPGKTNDDKTLSDCSQFENKEVTVTLKMDGENTTCYQDGYIHARSLENQSHPSRDWVKNYLLGKCFELPVGWRICGENLFAKHSIYYTQLVSYFNVFSIWDETNNCLSWSDTVTWSKLLDLHHVPAIYTGIWDEDKVMRKFLEHKHSLICNSRQDCEGFVVRLSSSFSYANFRRSVAKYVRAEHVTTNQHWIRTAMVRNELVS